ncbi:MAG: PAS domain S-box protein [Bacteroidales bacterium]|nr:PAS domain S-box protein [Bacteroidales bacterium]
MDNKTEIEKLRADCQALEEQVKLLVRTELKLRRTQAELIQSREIIEEYSMTLEQKVEERTKELSMSEKRFKDIVFNSADWIWEVNENGRFIYCSEKVEDILGYTNKEIIGKPFYYLSLPNEAQRINQKFLKIASKRKPIKDMENWILTRNGSQVCLLTDGVPVFDDSGNFKGYRGINKDITYRKKAEELIKASELQYRRLFESAKDGILILDFNTGRINDINPSLSNLLGITKEETAGKKMWEVIFFDEPAETKSLFKEMQKKEYVQNENLCLKTREEHYIDIELVSNVYTAGRKKVMQCNFRDISERKHAEKMRFEKEAAETANRTKSEFLSHMSHEIRSPLNAIIGFSDLLVHSVEDEDQRSQVNIILNNANNLLNIINDILDLSKIEAGELGIEPAPVNINNLVKNVENVFINKIKEKGLSFIVEKDSNIPAILMLDEVRMQQILVNLIGNACKFTTKGYIKLILDKVSMHDGNDKMDLSVSVEDSGIGIPPEQQALIFEAFRQQLGQNTKIYGGTGLGLTITKKLVEMMGGTISVTSTPGHGSTFTIELSDIQVPRQEIISADETVFNPRSILFDKAKILICDDNQTARRLIMDVLKYSPLDFIEAENGEKAINAAMQYRPDLILMDLIMPEINGYDAARFLREHDHTRNIPVIAISASYPKNEEQKSFQSLFNGFLIKPVNLKDLFEMMKKYLSHKAVG